MIKQKIQSEQLQALKSGNKPKLNALRYILAQIQNKEINKKSELTDEEVTAVLKKVAKDLKESIDSFQKAGRKDLVDEYSLQLAVLEPYLPKELSDEDLEKEVLGVLDKNKEMASQNSKALIGICVKELKAKAEPVRIIQMLNRLTSKS